MAQSYIQSTTIDAHPSQTTWHAAGLNAHCQLIDNNGRDVFTFTPLWLPHTPSTDDEDDDSGVTLFFTSWSSTILRKSTGLLTLGHQASLHHPNLSTLDVQKLHSAFGDHNSLHGCLGEDGNLYAVDAQTESLIPQAGEASPKISHIAVAGNGMAALLLRQNQQDQECRLLQFLSIDEVFHWYHSPSSADNPPDTQTFLPGQPTQLVAGIGTFFLLMKDGSLYSWGDPRYRSLGREICNEEPADRPCLVDALGGLDIVRVVAGGWMGAALSKDGAAYVWGSSMPGMDHGTMKVLSDAAEAGEVSLIEIEGSEKGALDALDVAVGDGHVAVVVEGGRLFVCGENGNGQLGLGDSAPEFVGDWTEIMSESRFQAVVCGPRATFALRDRGALL